jgi:hypothetical protein
MAVRCMFLLQAHPIKKGGEIPREKTMPKTVRMSDVTGGKSSTMHDRTALHLCVV